MRPAGPLKLTGLSTGFIHNKGPREGGRLCRVPKQRRNCLADDAAAEADGYGMGAGARLELREQVADVGLDRLLRQEEPLTDLPVHKAVRDQLKYLDLAHRRLLLQLAERALERDDLGARGGAPAGGDLLEAARMIRVPVQDLLALCGVHAWGIGLV